MKLFGALWSHPMLAFRTTTVITYLNSLNYSTSLAAIKKTRLWALKTVYYVWILQISLRTIVVVQLNLTSEAVLAAYLPFNPMIVMLVRLFGAASLNASLICGFVLGGQGVIHLDYAVTALIKAPYLLSLIHFMVAGNGRHFAALNAHRLGGWPKRASERPFWQLWRLPFDYIVLSSRIWRTAAAVESVNALKSDGSSDINQLINGGSSSSSSTSSLQFSPPPPSTASIRLSDSLRARVYVYSAAWEAVATAGSIVSCKCAHNKFKKKGNIKNKMNEPVFVNIHFFYFFVTKTNQKCSSAHRRRFLPGHFGHAVRQQPRTV